MSVNHANVMSRPDFAKSVFQFPGNLTDGHVAVKMKQRHPKVVVFSQAQPPCPVDNVACATAHHWARSVEGWGRTVRFIKALRLRTHSQKSTVAARAMADRKTFGHRS